MIYIVIFFFLAFTSLLDLVVTSKVIRYGFLLCTFIILAIVAGMRWEVGPDWESYHSFFVDYEQYRDGVYINMLEPGYTFLNGLIKAIGGNYTTFLFFIAILTIGLKYSIFTRHPRITFVVIFFYYCYYLADVASTRQFTSLSITLLSSIFIIKRRPVLFVLCVILATSIHISSIAFLAAYWIYHKNFSKRTLAIVLCGTFVLGFLNVSGLMLGKVIGLLGSSSIYAEKLLKYSESGVDSTVGNPYISFLLGALKRAVIIPFLFYYRERIDSKDHDIYRGYLNLLIMGNAIYFLFIISFPEVTRLSVSYLYFEIFLLGFALISIKDRNLKMVVFLLMILFGGFRLYSFMAPYMNLYIPYKTFIN
ncbi:EpsG family protein [Mucilaginibacter sabulilitoris]|uniref:EpsG family protein n=1 Tax=Mucilaginibacter sabulilitoris TaxID=1173583 RepID=A0ABZ0TSA1_9SPHI|nr:EpsG family protein [Mucilaginibacter sabulilitoris]WPU95799.1 EpsG family protein [Mucilaginibacter sabulilitoris]